MKKTLIILAHPDLTRSMANKKLKEEAEKNTDIKGLQEKFKDVEEKIGVRVYLQHKNIFKAMNRI